MQKLIFLSLIEYLHLLIIYHKIFLKQIIIQSKIVIKVSFLDSAKRIIYLMEISQISGFKCNIKKYDKILRTFHLRHFVKKVSVFSEHVQLHIDREEVSSQTLRLKVISFLSKICLLSARVLSDPKVSCFKKSVSS